MKHRSWPTWNKGTRQKWREVVSGAVLGRGKRSSKGLVNGISGAPQRAKTYFFRGMIAAGWPSTTKPGEADVTAAAEDLGYSKSSIRNWMRTGAPPDDIKAHNRILTQARRKGMPRELTQPLDQATTVADIVDKGWEGNASQAARDLGVSPASMRRWRNQDRIPDPAEADKFHDIARHKGVSIPTETYDVEGMLLARYGTDKRGRLHLKAAEQDLGVSRGVINGWRKRGNRAHVTKRKGSKKAAAAFGRLVKEAPDAVDSPQGRRTLAQAGADQAQGMPSIRAGMRIGIVANQGPTDDPDYYRDREIHSDPLTEDQANTAMGVWVDEGPEGFAGWLDGYLGGTEDEDANYYADWHIADPDQMWFHR